MENFLQATALEQSAMYDGMPTVAVVILNWNGKHYLQQFLPFVLQSAYPALQIVVADNASSDDSVQFIRQHFPQVRVIQNDRNEGFANGYNTALKQVQAKYYALLNSDVEVPQNWISPVITLMESDDSIAACQPKILSFHQKEMFEYAGACGGWIDALGYPFSRGRVFDVCEKDHGQYDTAAPCFWATGAAMIVRASVFHDLRGFDGFFFAHQEEIDLCWRMQLAGHRVFVQPESAVYHVGGGTLPKGNSLKTFLNFRNNLVMIYKNYSRPAMYVIIITRLMLDAVAAWKALLGGDSGFFKAVVKSQLHFARWIFFQQRKSIFPARRHRLHDGVYGGSVVWNYFVKGKKRFSEIVKGK